MSAVSGSGAQTTQTKWTLTMFREPKPKPFDHNFQERRKLVSGSSGTRLFVAKYPGRCDGNGCRIEEGDRIGYADGYDKPLCEACWCADREETAPVQACPNCFTVHAGECL